MRALGLIGIWLVAFAGVVWLNGRGTVNLAEAQSLYGLLNWLAYPIGLYLAIRLIRYAWLTGRHRSEGIGHSAHWTTRS
jgi:hypothetical protein